MSDVVLAIAGELSLEPVLRKLVTAARELVGARYAALGIPDADGTGFARFITAGMSDELIDAIGPLPRTHGLLGAMLTDPAPLRTDDIAAHPRFQWWPAAHPRMRSFLGVPILSKGDVVGAFYLTDKEGSAGFDDADQRVIELLAAHAAIAIDNAHLFERSRELSVAEERSRLAGELHDAMAQNLFSLSLTAEAAATRIRTDPDRAEAQLRLVGSLARDTMAELRSLIYELRPPQLAAEGLVETLRKHVALLARAHHVPIALQVHGDGTVEQATELQVLRVAQEALHNALRHAEAATIEVVLTFGAGGLRLVVRDDGRGFDRHARAVSARRLGLTSMRERARSLGGRLRVDSARGAGTTVTLDVPGG
ncbi:MAG: GAF domain-containing sensor histidine kinase [Euzebyales bacterium]|nr:GAF domain-containing sensor histidine kinase [Euzebyales bacterium]